MRYLISYDISEDRLRTRLAKYLRQQGCQRLQKSVFLSPAYPSKEWKRVLQGLQILVKPTLLPTDSMVCIGVRYQDLEQAVVLGNEALLKTINVERLFFIV